jgi:hypothetical protein
MQPDPFWTDLKFYAGYVPHLENFIALKTQVARACFKEADDYRTAPGLSVSRRLNLTPCPLQSAASRSAFTTPAAIGHCSMRQERVATFPWHCLILVTPLLYPKLWFRSGFRLPSSLTREWGRPLIGNLLDDSAACCLLKRPFQCSASYFTLFVQQPALFFGKVPFVHLPTLSSLDPNYHQRDD